MTTASKITMIRIFLLPVFFVLMLVDFPGHTWWALGVFILSSVTDTLDGHVARKYDQVSDFGKFMDPLADKFLVIAALIGILVNPYFDYLRTFFVWAVVIVIFREFAVTSMRMIAANKAGKVIAAAWLGKIKTTTQMICILVIFLEPIIPFKPFCEWHILSFITMAAMTVMTLWSGIDYLVKYWEYIGTAK